MSTIIDQTYFQKAELKLPVDNITTQDYIDIHEPIILRKILGYSLYKEFIASSTSLDISVLTPVLK